ncbi:MAG TPA: extracellular solute-binding protein [Nocardioides sp.]|uniref:ABC transporter substrate-binding protein n=1 Tax=uncultured Nocardioides sp. TaxID=198441 RepID=UPI00260FF36B|nr:extracellular solute-binding protein [uncultured Nocardioides sp.]HRI98258.1 extracellular solute-binding protein [Nocardioides sp.]HRK47797.1 extracellular solute-binding protein [Nocardioides sp.]
MRRSWIVVPLVLVLGAAVAGCTGDDDPGPDQPEPSTPPAKVALTFGVWGTKPEVDAYQGVVDTWNAYHPETQVKIKAYANHEDLLAAIQDGKVPDVFQVSRADLPVLRDQELNRPIGELLDERNVDFGDGYSRPALEAFSSDRKLQCMPYGISPMVIYYNPKLVDFEAMAARGLDVPTVDYEDLTKRPTWTFEQFQAAAEYASRPRRGIAGFYIAPTLRGLAPFVLSGGGQIFDDEDEPSSLAFSSDDTKSALEEVLPLLRDPKVTLTPDQLAEKTPLEWFREGKLGMIAGFRDLVPELRPTGTLDFDILPMPIVNDPATVGDLTGICIAQDTPNVAQSADFLVDFISEESVAAVAGAGYLAPANTKVALSDAFLQPGRAPVHSGVSNNSIKNMVIPPLVEDYQALEEAVAAPIRALMEVEVLDLDALTQQIDEASQTVLAPPEEPSESESPSEDESP